MSSRVPHVSPDVRARVRAAVQRNDTSFMNHFVKNRDEARRLYDLCSIAINYRENGTRHAARDAADVIAEVFPGCRARIVIARSFRNAAGSRLRRQVWNSAIWRIDNQRCLLARPPGSFAPMGRRPDTGPSVRREEFLFVVFGLSGQLGLALSNFQLSQIKPLPNVRGPLHRRPDAIVACPSTLKIRIAPRRLGCSPALGGSDGFTRHRGRRLGSSFE